MEISKDDLK